MPNQAPAFEQVERTVDTIVRAYQHFGEADVPVIGDPFEYERTLVAHRRYERDPLCSHLKAVSSGSVYTQPASGRDDPLAII
jgi:vancomycin permeability regulator SanA